jgi:GT2 family glycosyltransferase
MADEPRPPAPAVVAVVVTCDPGPWLEEALGSLGDQDYPNFSVLVVDAASTRDPTNRIARCLPDAFVCRLERRTGFGTAINEGARLIQGASHLLACHDDVALAPGALRELVGQAFRHNAGIATPKFTRWDDPDRLVALGGSCDRAGVRVDLVEPGELDQGQHDVVREVFYAPSGATLIRADLFEALGGFDEAADCYGEDLDLCWRARLAGARVVAVPDARVRHLQATASGKRPSPVSLSARRRGPTPSPRRLEETHRIRTLLTCYHVYELAWILPLALLWALVEAGGLVMVGRRGQARELLAGVAAGPWPLRGVLAARRRVQRSRAVGDAALRKLHSRGNARLRALARGMLQEIREEASHLGQTRVVAASGDRSDEGRPRSGRATAAVWVGVVLIVLFGTRNLLGHELPQLGQLPDTSAGWSYLWRSWWSAWQQGGLGAAAPASPALALLGLADTALMGAAGTLQHLVVLGPLLIGPFGAWRAARRWAASQANASPSAVAGDAGSSAAAVATIAYAAAALPYNALANGRWPGLVAYAAAPFMLSSLCRLSGATPLRTTSMRGVSSRVVGLGLLVAVVASVAPSFIFVAAVSGLALAVGSILSGDARPGLRAAAFGGGGAVVAVVLLLPWSADVLGSGVAIFGVAPGASGRTGFGQVLRMATGPFGRGWAGWALLVVAALPLVIGAGWRLAWAIRLWTVALVFFWWTWADSRGWLPAVPPEVCLAPAAAALAASAGLGAAAFQADLPRFRFGWRQVAAAIAGAALVAAAVPVLAASVGGRFKVPASGPASVLAFLPSPSESGDYRVLWVGAPGTIPMAGEELQPGVAYAASYDGLPRLADLWLTSRQGAIALLGADLRLAEQAKTTRLGHLLAPMAVRFIVVPSSDAPAGTGGRSQPPPPAILQGLTQQRDLQALNVDPNYTVYENAAWAPAVAVVPAAAQSLLGLSGPGARRAIQQVDLSSFTPLKRGEALPVGSAVYFSATHDSSWRLSGTPSFPPARAFGWAMSFTLQSAAAGAAPSYRPPLSVRAMQVLQVLLWLVAATLAIERFGGYQATRRAGRHGQRMRRREVPTASGAAHA